MSTAVVYCLGRDGTCGRELVVDGYDHWCPECGQPTPGTWPSMEARETRRCSNCGQGFTADACTISHAIIAARLTAEDRAIAARTKRTGQKADRNQP